MTSRSVIVCANSETSICTARSNRPRRRRVGFARAFARTFARARAAASRSRREGTRRCRRSPRDDRDARRASVSRDAREGRRARERKMDDRDARSRRARAGGGEGGATARGEDADAGFTARGAGFFRADESAGDGARGIQRRVFGEFRDFGVRGGDGVYVGARVEGASVRERCER